MRGGIQLGDMSHKILDTVDRGREYCSICRFRQGGPQNSACPFTGQYQYEVVQIGIAAYQIICKLLKKTFHGYSFLTLGLNIKFNGHLIPYSSYKIKSMAIPK